MHAPFKRAEKGRVLDALCATTDWHRKHAVRALGRRAKVKPGKVEAPGERKRRYGATIKDAITAMGGAGSGVRQAAQGDDPDFAAGP